MTDVFLLLLLLTGQARGVTLMDDVVTIPGGQWRSVPIQLKQQSGVVRCSFRLIHGSAGVRAVILTRDQANRLREEAAHSVLAGTGYAREAEFVVPVMAPGEYELVIDNNLDRRDAAELHLSVALAFGDSQALRVRNVEPEKRALILWLSGCYLAAMAWFSGLRLRRAWAKRPPPEFWF